MAIARPFNLPRVNETIHLYRYSSGIVMAARGDEALTSRAT
jgi:hypothetical protein